MVCKISFNKLPKTFRVFTEFYFEIAAARTVKFVFGDLHQGDVARHVLSLALEVNCRNQAITLKFIWGVVFAESGSRWREAIFRLQSTQRLQSTFQSLRLHLQVEKYEFAEIAGASGLCRQAVDLAAIATRKALVSCGSFHRTTAVLSTSVAVICRNQAITVIEFLWMAPSNTGVAASIILDGLARLSGLGCK